MQDGDSKFEDIPADIAIFNKLVMDNESLKQRVDALEKSFKDAQKEILALQECISTLLSTELQKDKVEPKKEPRRSENYFRSENPPNDRSRIDHETSQFTKEFWRGDSLERDGRDSHETTAYKKEVYQSPNKVRGSRETTAYSKEVYPSPNKFKAYEGRRSMSYDVKRYNRSPERDSKSRAYNNAKRSPEHSSRGRHNLEHVDSAREIGLRPQIRRHSNSSRDHHVDGAPVKHYDKSLERLSNREQCYITERSNRVYDQKSSAREKYQRRDSKYSEECHRTTERPTFEHRSEHDRRDESLRRSQRSEQSYHQFNDVRQSQSVSSNNVLDSRKHIDSPLKRRSDPEMLRSPRNRNELKLPSEDLARRVKNSEQSQRRSRDSAVVRENQHFENTQPKKPVINLKEELARAAAIQNRKQLAKGNERKTSDVDMPSSSEITLWSNSGETRTIIRSEDLNKLHFTPMKMVNSFPNYELISPLQNTPDPPKEKLKEINPLIFPSQVSYANKSRELLKSDTKVEAVPFIVADTSFENEEKRRSRKRDSVEIQTVIKTDDAEHGVFQRKRRVLKKIPMT